MDSEPLPGAFQRRHVYGYGIYLPYGLVNWNWVPPRCIVALSNHCKRRRMSSFCNEEMDENSKNCWNSMSDEDPFLKFCNLRQNCDLAPEEDCCTLKKVVYPFETVKPGSIEGEVTLEDINKRMVMRPTRPIRHPVGDFACRPCVTAGGLGLSGKAVVALTRIRTRGQGSVTIIKTRG